MNADLQTYVAFHRTGRRSPDLPPVETPSLRPALLARFRDLTSMRFDFPLVLIHGDAEGVPVRALSELLDDAIHALAHDPDGQRVAAHVGRLERQIRTLVAQQGGGKLSDLWIVAATRLGVHSDEQLRESLDRARAALTVDGDVVGCDRTLPALLLGHVWQAAQRAKARRFQSDAAQLVRRLSELVRGNDARSATGRTPARLKAGVGTGFEDAFDFGTMSSVLSRSAPKTTLTDTRRARVESLVAALQAPPFFAEATNAAVAPAGGAFSFVFSSVVAARDAYRARLPELVAAARAVAMAELEVAGEYREARHDGFFQQFGPEDLAPQDLALFPDYLVTLPPGPLSPVEQATLMEALSAGLPIKALVQTDDLVDAGAGSETHLTLDLRSRQLASMAMGQNDVYVLQAPASHLPQMRRGLERGMTYPGPALFCVYSGDAGRPGHLAPYLVAAAALESRAFPAFCYDPAAGGDWASRFDLSTNPQPDLDWPVHRFAYEDEIHQAAVEHVAFTAVDFIACDSRSARHLARTTRPRWIPGMLPVSNVLASSAKTRPDQVPYLWMADADNTLHRVVADEALLREARRCREMWHSLQELGGFHNSYADRALARERERRQVEASAHATTPIATPATGTAASVTHVPAAATAPAPTESTGPGETAAAGGGPEPASGSGEAHIETARCSTCNECTQINSRMFAYNENRQAYIANPDAGTFRELVEAAESCQVSIIHPGQPRNPNEAGLDELIERAKPFL
jgi:hypothetical protein